MAKAKSLYDSDLLAWSKQQARALRASAAAGSNQVLDWPNLAEEIEELGKSQRSSVASHIMRIIQHLVKLDHSPMVEPRAGWRKTIRLARLQIEKRLEANPSLRPELPHLIELETRRGVELAIADLEDQGEIDEVDAAVLRRARYTQEQVLGDWFPAEPPRDAG